MVEKKTKRIVVTSTEIADLLAKLKKYRAREERYKNLNKMLQEELIPLMREVDESDDQRFGFTYQGEKMAGKVIQGKPSERWTEGLVDALKEEGYWESVSSEVLDYAKLQSAISRGEIPASFVDQYREEGNAPRAYVRFVNPEGGE